jgi:hypothetical protein
MIDVKMVLFHTWTPDKIRLFWIDIVLQAANALIMGLLAIDHSMRLIQCLPLCRIPDM